MNFWQFVSHNRSEVLELTLEHLWLVGVSLLFSILIGIPLGIAAVRFHATGQAILLLSAVIQTVPSLALLCFLIPLFGVGTAPALAALCLYSLLPVVLNTYTGIRGIDARHLENARAFGLSKPQILRLYLQLAPLAEARGFLYAHPDGKIDSQGKYFWNATDACCDMDGSGVDDSAYLDAIIKEVEATYNVDRSRIYLIGHSNGGFMSYRMACDHADEIAALVSLEAATYAGPRKCAPSEPVATLEIHGTSDDTISYDGGKILGHRYPGAVATTKMWAKYDGCRLVPDSPAPAPHDIEANMPPATVTAYSTGCAPNGHAELWTEEGGSHIPKLTPTFGEQVVAYLLAHPKS